MSGLVEAGVHTNTRSSSPSGSSSTSATVRMPSTSSRLRLVACTAPCVAGREQVVERDEAELAGVGGRAGDHHAARLEQGEELLAAVQRFGPGRRRCSRLAQLDQCVHRHGNTVGGDDQRVDVDARDVGTLEREPTEPDQRRRQVVACHRRLAAELAEQTLRRQPVDHLGGRHGIERGRTEDHVGDRLGEHASHPEHHGRSELRIAHQSGDQLSVATDHLGHQHGDVAVGGRGRGEQRRGGILRRRHRPEAEANQAALGLVGDRSPTSFATTGKPISVAAATAPATSAATRSSGTVTP
jgi:hypothetical protein